MLVNSNLDKLHDCAKQICQSLVHFEYIYAWQLSPKIIENLWSVNYDKNTTDQFSHTRKDSSDLANFSSTILTNQLSTWLNGNTVEEIAFLNS